MSKKLREFNVTVQIRAEVGVALRAESMEEALAKAKEIKTADIIDFGPETGFEHNDSKDPVVVSVFESVPL